MLTWPISLFITLNRHKLEDFAAMHRRGLWSNDVLECRTSSEGNSWGGESSSRSSAVLQEIDEGVNLSHILASRHRLRLYSVARIGAADLMPSGKGAVAHGRVPGIAG
jgi:hypothetical protein